MSKWRKGQSGNLRGRPRGSSQVEKLRASLAKHVPDIIAALVASAKEGDTAAAKLILEWVIPAVKSEELPVSIALPSKGLAEQGGAILVGMAKGGLAPSQAASMLGALASQAHLARDFNSGITEKRTTRLNVESPLLSRISPRL